ncbi:MAG: ATP-binding protein [Bacteroidota bacterium]|jgi:signal transduction histidine kinase
MDGQLHIIRAFTQSLSANTSLEKVCRELVSKTIDYLGETTIAVYLFSEKSQELVRIACRNNRDRGIPQPHPSLSEQSDQKLVWRTYRKGATTRCNPPPKRQQKILERRNPLSEMAVPIIYADKPLGVVYMANHGRNKFTEDTQLFVSVISSIAATVIVKTLASAKLGQTENLLNKSRGSQQIRKKKLDEIRGRMDEILYSLSHDFRGPVLTTMSLINRLSSNPDKLGEYQPLLKKTVSRLDSILLNIYYYSNNLREPVQANAVLPAAVINEIADFIKHEFRTDFNLTLTSNADGYIITDEKRFKVIIRSILINAVLYGFKGDSLPEIFVNLDFSMEACMISIEDNGPGMPKELLNNKTKMFKRGTTASHGAGIGIFVCRELAQKIGAKITWSNKPGVGTKVELVVRNRD